jgi:peroxiredoxin
VQTGNDGKARRGALLPAAVAVGVAVAVVIGFAYVYAPRATRVHVGDIAPDFTLPVINGGPPVRLSSSRGGPTLLLFFNTQRDGNEAYIGSLQKLKKRFVEEGLTILAVALDTDPDPVRFFLNRIYVEFPILSDPQAATLHETYGTPRDPEAYLLDRSGRVLAVFTERVDWNTTEFLGLLKNELHPPASPR